ncbi:MAG: FliH/SctL family protein [Sporichthyaceae bacterium]
MTSSPDRLLRGRLAAQVPSARMDAALAVRRGAVDLGHDARLVDPTLSAAFDEIAESVRTAARAEGYAIGWAQGRRAAAEAAELEAAVEAAARAAREATAAAAFARALRALEEAAQALERRAVVPAADLGDAVVAASFELAGALLGRELALAQSPGLDAVRRALRLLPENRPVTARLHPADAELVRAAIAALPPGELGREVLVVADPAVEAAGAIVECDASRVDAQLGPALDRAREALGL